MALLFTVPMDWSRLQLDQIRSRLAQQAQARPASCDRGCAREYRPAGVLAPLIRVGGAWHLLFIRRTCHDGDRHSGQVAFPGGKREPADRDIRATALRETMEELGVERDRLQVLGCLPAYHSSTGYCITAQVGVMDWPCRLDPQRREVARVFSVPLTWLADGNNWWRETVERGDGQRFDVIRYADFDGECLWGATAVMVQQLLHILHPGCPSPSD